LEDDILPEQDEFPPEETKAEPRKLKRSTQVWSLAANIGVSGAGRANTFAGGERLFREKWGCAGRTGSHRAAPYRAGLRWGYIPKGL